MSENATARLAIVRVLRALTHSGPVRQCGDLPEEESEVFRACALLLQLWRSDEGRRHSCTAMRSTMAEKPEGKTLTRFQRRMSK